MAMQFLYRHCAPCNFYIGIVPHRLSHTLLLLQLLLLLLRAAGNLDFDFIGANHNGGGRGGVLAWSLSVLPSLSVQISRKMLLFMLRAYAQRASAAVAVAAAWGSSGLACGGMIEILMHMLMQMQMLMHCKCRGGR